jgi:hypothetical protein
MTRARDLANIADGTFTATDLNLSGTLDVSGDATFDTNTLFVDVSANAVGIGTTSPSASFTLKAANNSYSGGFRLEGTDETTALSITHVNGDNFFSGNSTDDHLVLTGSGNVGIGTSSPSTLVEASKSQNAVTDVKVTNVNTGTAAQARFTLGNSGSNFGSMGFLGGSFTTSGVYRQDGAYVYSNGGGGLTLVTGAAQPIYFAINNSEKMRIDSSGNVGIGTDSPSFATGTGLEIQRTTATATMRLEYTGSNAFELSAENAQVTYNSVSSKPHVFEIGSAEAMRIDASGNLGLGVVPNTWSVGKALELGFEGNALWGNAADEVIVVQNAYYNSGWKYATTRPATHYSQYNGGHRWFTAASGTADAALSWTQAMTLDSSGNLLVGKSTVAQNTVAGIEIKPAGDISSVNTFANGVGENIFLNRHNGTGDFILFRKTNVTVGSISTNGSTTSYNTSSDARLKENIADAEDAGAKVDAIQVRQFDWKTDGTHQDYGMVAQELMTVAPEAVSGDPESDDMMGVDYSKLVPMLVKEIQSLRARVAQLEGV